LLEQHGEGVELGGGAARGALEDRLDQLDRGELAGADPLRRLAADLRAGARRRAETRARKVPVRLLFPLVGCTLPAFVLVTVVPPVLGALGSLDL